MLVQRTKNAIKSIPFLYNLLRPLLSTSSRMERVQARARQYCSSLPQVVSDPVFVKVGANDGISDDPLSDILLANAKWKGLLIEPVPYCFDHIRATFHDAQRFTLEQVAIGATTGKAIFYYVDEKAAKCIPDLPDWYDKLGSFDKNNILKHLNGVVEPFIVEHYVEVLPLSDVLKRNGIRKVHLLHIDTEGHDYEVLKTLDFANMAPIAIFLEHKHLPSTQKAEVLSLLRKHGYSVGDCGADYFAVNKKAKMRLKDDLPAPKK